MTSKQVLDGPPLSVLADTWTQAVAAWRADPSERNTTRLGEATHAWHTRLEAEIHANPGVESSAWARFGGVA